MMDKVECQKCGVKTDFVMITYPRGHPDLRWCLRCVVNHTENKEALK